MRPLTWALNVALASLLCAALLVFGSVSKASAETYEQAVEGTSGLTHFWPMGESSGSSFADVAGGDTASVSSGVTLGEPGALVGDSATSALFNGTTGDAHAEVNLSGTHQLTIEFWMKWHAFAGDNKLALEFTPNFNTHPGGFLVDPDATPGTRFSVAVGQTSAKHNNNSLFERPSAEQWHYYAFVINTEASGEKEVTPYVDGHAVSYTKLNSETGAGNFANSTLYWMSRDASELFGQGSMQDLALYDTTLSATTIAEHYEIGKGGLQASFQSTPVDTTVGVPVHFNAAGSSSPAGTITDYAWDFDGSKSYSTDGGEAATIAHTFTSTGTYTVDLRVKDSLGETATISKTVTVGAALGQYEQAVEDTEGVSHFWPMSESSGSSLADVFGGDNASLSSGGVTLGEPGALVENTSTSALFDGSTGSAHAEVNLSETKQLTIEFWMKWHAFAGDNKLALEFTPNFNTHPGGFLVDPDATPGTDFSVGVGQYTAKHSNNALFERPSAEQWHYYAFVINTEASGEKEITPYVDGHAVSYTKLNSETGAGDFANSTLYWMSRDASELFGKGAMQDLALYDTTLSSTAILEHYERGKNTYHVVNSTPPSIEGTARDGQTLTANHGSWTGFEPISYAYRWERCNSSGGSCANISGATGSTYTLGHSDVGDTIRVIVAASNTGSSAESTSEKTGTVVALAPSNTTPPAISGTAEDGQRLSASAGEWAGTPPIEYGYQWERCNGSGESCANISGATGSSYTLGTGDLGTTLRVKVTASNGGGSASVSSGATSVVVEPPVDTAAPAISGTPRQGQELTASTGTWTAYPEASYTYQWERCYGEGASCADLSGATEAKYLLGAVVAGSILRVTVTATSSAGSASASSHMTIPIESLPPADTAAPEITGTTQEGREVSASTGTWEGSPPLGYAYQWEDCDSLGYGCMPIPGASGQTYVPGPADVGGTLRVQVTASNMANSATVFSAASAVVTPGPFHAAAELGTEGSGEGQLEDPGDVAIDASGDIWVLDTGNDRVEELNAEGAFLRQFGSAGSEHGQLSRPAGLALGVSGDVWVADRGNNRVEEFSATGEYLRSFGVRGTKNGDFKSPGGIAIDGGSVWVSDSQNGRVQRFSEAGEYEATVAGTGSAPGEVGEPEGMAVDAKGDVWVADSSNQRVEEFGESGEYLREITGEGVPGEAMSPYGVAVTGGDVFVGDVASDRVVELAEDGEYLAQFGTPGAELGQLRLGVPMGLATDSHGDVWVTDTDNDRLQEWVPSPAAPASVTTPSVSGEAVAGETLSATAGSWSGDPLEYRYQWQLCSEGGSGCSAISGADGQRYVLPHSAIGATVRVEVSASNAGGTATEVSAATATIAAATSLSNIALPAISGAAQDGRVLHAGTGTWSGSPPSSYAYQWESCNESGGECAAIEGATEAAYALGEGDIGTKLRVSVTATNDAGTARATSAASAVVTPEPPSELEAPTVSGTPDAGEVLDADHGAWTGTERQIAYQWESCSSGGGECAAIEGATEAEYDLGEGDVGTTVRVRVGVGSALASLTDVSTATPVIGAAGALASTAQPAVSGVPRAGHTLTASEGGWANGPTATYAYQWRTCNQLGEHCEAIEGATGASYSLEAANVGQALRVEVTATEGTASRTRVSAATQPVAASEAPASTEPPAIEGAALRGQALTVGAGQWSGEAPSGYTYQWERCEETGVECAAIEGATASSYTPTEADVGKTLRAVVTATNGSASTAAVSVRTETVDPESLFDFSTPSIAGTVEDEGNLLAEPGIWSGVGAISYAYQWERCNAGGGECTAIEGADEDEYTPVEKDDGKALRVKVTATGPLGSDSAYSAVTAATPGGEATVEAAEETAQRYDPAVFEPSTSATLEGQTIAPALEDGEELTSKQALTTTTISKEDPGEFAVNTPVGELSLKPLETFSKASTLPTLVNETAALFANAWPATDAIVRPEALGAGTVLQLRSAEAPHTFSWEVGLGAGQKLQQLSDGSVAVVKAEEAFTTPPPSAEPESPHNRPEPPETHAEEVERESEEAAPEEEVKPEPPPSAPRSSTSPAETPAGLLEPQHTLAQYEAATTAIGYAEGQVGSAILMSIPTPRAVDADGHTVPASLSVSGDTVRLTLKPGGTVAYPVMVALPVAALSDKTSGERDPFEYGLSDLHSITFSEENHKIAENVARLKNPKAPLYIQTVRLATPWDIMSSPSQHEKLEEAKKWVTAVEKDGLEPYITFEADKHARAKSVHEYRRAIRELMKEFIKQGVTRWGAWNEPDHASNTVSYEQAAHYWQAAESVAVELGCSCTVVAGEFYEYPDQEHPNYPADYKKTLEKYDPEAWKGEGEHAKPNRHAWKRHKIPGIWGFHDYKDVVEARNKNASEFQKFASGGNLGKPKVWVSEAGAELYDNAGHTRLAEPPEIDEYTRQEAAAEAFLTLHEATPSKGRISRIERVYYYNYSAPSEAKVKENANAFDSGLVEAEPEVDGEGKSHGEPRPAYCYLAYESHRCPPTVVTLAGRSAQANSYGVSAEASFEWEFLKSREVNTVKVQSIGSDVFRSQLISVEFIACAPYRYRAIVKNSYGETATGSWIEVNTYCT